MIDRRLAWMVLVFGVLVLAGGVTAGVLKGSVASVGAGGALGLALGGCGAAMLAGRAAAVLPAIALCALTALVMGWRLLDSGKLMPGLPVGVLALALGGVLVADRRRRSRAGPVRATPPSR